ncbi:MAG: aminotransferase class V-fold PLP-dependent enzyme [Phycisphaerae bacterium]|jgi:cysteine desulfurase / selenocysteine lyase|nr:aminotransferase class V-fold PLP-dependent enzyme [Phycisphaerae bacterium]
MQLYFDNAATSFPKPQVVIGAMAAYQNDCGASPGRGAYRSASGATNLLDLCRGQLCTLVHAPSPEHCIFTLNCTDALNLAIVGTATHFLALGEPVHIVTTAMAHNSVLRPLSELDQRGVTHTVVPVDPITGLVDPKDIKKAITKSTKLVVVAHGSNVTGTVQDIETIGVICEDIPFLVDAAQTMGHIPIDVQRMNIAMLAFPGHKGLLGPLGTGGLIIKPGIEHTLATIRTGGTGSASEFPVQPSNMPDKYESGSHNMVGIAGLSASLSWILERGVQALQEREQELCELFLRNTKNLSGVSVVGPRTENRCGVFSLRFDENPLEIAIQLETEFGIQSRAGLHCAPFAHETMGTSNCNGTVRVSFGAFHTEEDITYLSNTISTITQKVLS